VLCVGDCMVGCVACGGILKWHYYILVWGIDILNTFKYQEMRAELFIVCHLIINLIIGAVLNIETYHCYRVYRKCYP
jgi:hypothetical protein